MTGLRVNEVMNTACVCAKAPGCSERHSDCG